MAIPPIPPIPPATVPGDFQLPGLDATAPADATTTTGGGFGQMLGDALGKLGEMHVDAAVQSQQLATGQASDVSAVAMSVERASLALQLAAQIRNKTVEAYQDLFRMQV
jgi:flagellar hook-basal body complex protein FliE